jgi:hypothetical protein
MDDSDSAGADFSVVHDRPSVIDADSARLFAAAAFGAVVGAVVGYFIRSFRASGDEAPIRVKGGSTLVDLLDCCAEWEDEDGGKKNWRLSRGTRSDKNYQVWITFKTPDGQFKTKMVIGEKVEVYHATDRWIEFKAPGKKTKLKSSHDQLKKQSGQELSHEYTVILVTLDDIPIYTSDWGTFEELRLLDPDYKGC